MTDANAKAKNSKIPGIELCGFIIYTQVLFLGTVVVVVVVVVVEGGEVDPIAAGEGTGE